MTGKPVTTNFEKEINEWLDELDGAFTPADWAEYAMSRAMLKKTKRPFLLPHLARAIKEAQDAAVRKYKRENE